MSLITTNYLFMTMNKKSLRVAIGNRKGSSPVVYIREIDSEDYMNDSYSVFINALNEKQGLEIEEAYSNNKKTAYSLFKKYFNTENAKEYGPADGGYISELVPDDWFDGCKSVLSLLDYKYDGFYEDSFDPEEFY
ncbi:MAG: hypothetical protein KBT48_04485 [Firmicutes bacterium]|nr:hypothetical protein [Bacillota bacterium]